MLKQRRPQHRQRSHLFRDSGLAILCVYLCQAVILADDSEGVEPNRVKPTAVNVQLVDGPRTSGVLSSLDAMELSVHTAAGEESRWPLTDVLWVARQDGVRMEQETPPLVLLANNDVLCGEVTAVDEEQLTLAWTGTTPPTSVSIPMESVRSIAFRQPQEPLNRTRIQRLWALLQTDKDRLISTDYTHIDGELVGLSENKVHLKTPLAMVSTPVEQLFAVILNSELSSAPLLEGSYVLITLVDGSRVTWDTLELNESGELSGATVWGTQISLPVDQVVQIQFLGDRVIAIAEVTPGEYVFTPYLTEKHPLIRNRNVRGGPLRLRGTSYATGLGMHSKSAVTYDLTDGSYHQFRAVVGVDDITGGDGSVVFSIEVDGLRVYKSPALTGKSPAEAVESINLVGAKSLKLIVDFGEFANISDIADWCNAVLIKSKN